MLFLNPWLLLALTGVSIPVILHLVRRQAAKPVDWGAMRFLMDTLSERRRRMEWEDLLLMAARCLLLALAALAVARPFVPPDAPAPWALVLPAGLLAIGLFGASFVFGSAGKRLLTRGLALAVLCLAAGMIAMEHWMNLRRFESSGSKDVALIIDASSSMTRGSGSKTLFDDALDEARRIVKEAPRGTSFAVILGGPSPQALSKSPISHRADVLAQLDGLQAVGGTFRAHEALGMATLALAEGNRPNRDIIVLTDSQRHGWQLDNAGAWQALEAAWKTFPAKPRLLLRSFPQAPSLRNAGIASISTARDLTGTDRPCVIRTEVVNTGNQPVTPGDLMIEIDGKEVAREALGMLIAGQTQNIETRHRFSAPGLHVVTAHLGGRDEIAGDDRADHVVTVRKALRVVLVDGNPAGSFFNRAGGHTALALAPATALIRGGQAGTDFLMDPVLVPAPEITAEVLAKADVVVLADVSRLPAAIAAAVAERTAAGAGLIVLAGPRADPAFYNTWNGPGGTLLPIELGAETGSEKGISPAPKTFLHEALAWAADERRSDMGGAVIRRWRKSTMTDGGTLAAAFGNGDPFLATCSYGRGRCAVATCAFDARAGTLPGRSSFVPLVHELVAWTAGGGVDWNLDPAWSPSVALDSRSSGGLSARYFRRNEPPDKPLLERVDPAIDFNWRDQTPDPKIPADNFSVQWRATLLPQIDGEYLIEAQADERVTVKIAGKTVLEQVANKPDQKGGRIRLEAGKPVPFEALYEEEGGPALVRLFWTPPEGTRHLIPSSAWFPANDGKPPAYEAIDPLGRIRKTTIPLGRRGRELRIDGPALPGLYQVKLPPAVSESITGIASATLPVVVRGEIAESRIDPLDEADFAQLRARTDVILPQSSADVLAVLAGKGFGSEITRTVTIAALVLLLLETALARWVSRSRRAGDDLRVEFGDSGTNPLDKGGWR